jgi:hypothetical protein
VGLEKLGDNQPDRRNVVTESSTIRETLNKSFDRLRTNGKQLISFVVSLSNHTANQLVQRFPSR